MPIADVIVKQIISAGYRVEVVTPDAEASDFYYVRATDPVTGKFWVTSGSTLADAATGLTRQLGLAPSEAADEFGSFMMTGAPFFTARYRAPLRLISWPIILLVTALIFLIDLLSPGLNLGIFYLIPLSMAWQIRPRPQSLLLLAAAMILLIYADYCIGDWPIFHTQSLEPGGLLNRGFAVLAIAGCWAIMIFFPRPPLSRRSPRTRPAIFDEHAHPAATDHSAKFVWLATFFICGTFLLDIFTPLVANFPIFYLLPLALLAFAGCRGSLWLLVSLLFGLTLLGFVASPRLGIDSHDLSLIFANRILTVAGFAMASLVFHLSAKTLIEVPSRASEPAGI